MRLYLPLLLHLCLSPLTATDFKPWFPRYLEFQTNFSYVHQNYSIVNEGWRSIRWPAKNDFYAADLELAYKDFCGEIECLFSGTKRHHLGPDCTKATIRYQLLDDIIGDPVSLVVGASFTQVFSLALKDISIFHHGHAEGEFHLSLGNEYIYKNKEMSRWWVVGGIGLGDKGSPWLRGELAWEISWCGNQLARLYALGISGLGGENLDVFKFDGYGPIAHRSIDFGAVYRYMFAWDGSLSIGYARRLYAKNCPEKTNFYYLSYHYAFGL